MLSQRRVTREKFTVDASTSVYVSFYLRAVCENVQPLVLGYLVFTVSRARCLSVSVSVSPFNTFCCRCRWYSTCWMSTGFRCCCNGWGLLLISSLVFISVTSCINPFCVFRFLGLVFVRCHQNKRLLCVVKHDWNGNYGCLCRDVSQDAWIRIVCVISALSRGGGERLFVVCYGRFGTTCRCHLQGSGIPKRHFKMEPIDCREISGNNNNNNNNNKCENKCETWCLSSGDHRWFKRSTRKKRPVTREDNKIIIINLQHTITICLDPLNNIYLAKISPTTIKWGWRNFP